MSIKKQPAVDWNSFLASFSHGTTIIECTADRNIFRQGDPADSVFYLRRGKVKLSVTSQQGKEAIVSVLDAKEFFGEGCLAGQPLRIATAIAVTDCTLTRIEKSLMTRILHERHEISELFVMHLLSRNIRFEADLTTEALPEGRRVKFTFYWPDAGRWEGADFMVAVGSLRQDGPASAGRNEADEE